MMDVIRRNKEQDKQALLDLYRLCNGENWETSTNWCSDRPLNKWYGVTTSNGRVTKLFLFDNQLSGDLSKWTSIANLTQLQALDLSDNQLSGDLSKWKGVRKWWQTFFESRYHILITRKLLEKQHQLDESIIIVKRKKYKTSSVSIDLVLQSIQTNILLKNIFDPKYTPKEIFRIILLYLDVRPEWNYRNDNDSDDSDDDMI